MFVADNLQGLIEARTVAIKTDVRSWCGQAPPFA